MLNSHFVTCFLKADCDLACRISRGRLLKILAPRKVMNFFDVLVETWGSRRRLLFRVSWSWSNCRFLLCLKVWSSSCLAYRWPTDGTDNKEKIWFVGKRLFLLHIILMTDFWHTRMGCMCFFAAPPHIKIPYCKRDCTMAQYMDLIVCKSSTYLSIINL